MGTFIAPKPLDQQRSFGRAWSDTLRRAQHALFWFAALLVTVGIILVTRSDLPLASPNLWTRIVNVITTVFAGSLFTFAGLLLVHLAITPYVQRDEARQDRNAYFDQLHPRRLSYREIRPMIEGRIAAAQSIRTALDQPVSKAEAYDLLEQASSRSRP